jgi:hypothetical protein
VIHIIPTPLASVLQSVSTNRATQNGITENRFANLSQKP